MEVVKRLNMPANRFFDTIIDSVLFDIRKQTGESLRPKQLNNYEYIKVFSKNSRAKIKIEKFVENESYHFRTSTTKNDFFVQYEIKPIDDQSCEVRYVEKMESYGFLQKLNDMVLGVMVGFLKKRRFVKMLEMIEAEY